MPPRPETRPLLPLLPPVLRRLRPGMRSGHLRLPIPPWCVQLALGPLLLWGCPQKNAETSQSKAPAAPPTLEPDRLAPGGALEQDREELHRAEKVPAWGDVLPRSAAALHVGATHISIGKRKVDRRASNWSEELTGLLGKDGCAVLLDSDPETFLADLAELFALLANARCEVWVRHPDAPLAFRVTLRDNGQFERWLNEPKPGKIRIIQRADGFELQTNIGKMPGADPNGPTVPTRGGQLDIARLRRGLEQLKVRFSNAEDSCLVPSYGTELASIGRALSGYYRGPEKRIFDELCLVYPTPARPPASPPAR